MSSVNALMPLSYEPFAPPVRAIRWDGTGESANAIKQWLNQDGRSIAVAHFAGDGKWIPTDENYLHITENHTHMLVRKHDYIIYSDKLGPIHFYKLNEFEFNQRYVEQDRYDIVTDEGIMRTFQPGKYKSE